MKRAILAVYQLLSTLLLPIIIIALLIRARTQAAYGQRLRERLGFCRVPTTHKNAAGSIVIHGASLGEITALKPFIQEVLLQFPHHSITITSFTPTGSSQVQKLFGTQVNHTYLPIDSPLCNRIFLQRLKPDAMVFMETELWPSLVQQAYKRGIKLLLINARLSKKSMRHYQKIRFLISPTLERFNTILAQSNTNKDHFLQLGADPKNTLATGNLKYDLRLNPKTEDFILHYQPTIKNRPVWVVGSSHQDEEALILAAFQLIQKKHPNILLIWAPRHPERHTPIMLQLEREKLSMVRRTQQQPPTEDTQVWLIDTAGELLSFYALATVCTVAGSFGSTGGHNPLEPALFAKATTLGPHMQNAAELTLQLLAANAVIQQQDSTALTLANNIIKLLNSHDERKTLGNNAQQLLQHNQGATQKALQTLVTLMLCTSK